MTARHGDLFHRSVALTAAVDDALEHLAEIEDTSRSHLMREALSMLFADRGIDVDATEGVQTNPLAVAERRKRRKAPPGDAVRAAFTEWWRDHARELTTASSDALLLDLVAGCVIEHIDRDGLVHDLPEDVLPVDDRVNQYGITLAVGELVQAGGIARVRKRRGPHLLRPAPWVGERNH